MFQCFFNVQFNAFAIVKHKNREKIYFCNGTSRKDETLIPSCLENNTIYYKILNSVPLYVSKNYFILFFKYIFFISELFKHCFTLRPADYIIKEITTRV